VEYDKTNSNAEGNILLRTRHIDLPESSQIRFEDVDGADNGGEFATREVFVEDVDAVKTGDKSGDWHRGDYEFNLGDVEMTLDGEE
jgi:hypothetical protein